MEKILQGQNNTNIKKLDKQLKKYGLSLNKENLEGVLNWVDWMYNKLSEDLAIDIADSGKCEPCGMSEWFIYHEDQAYRMKGHLICRGCEKKCDGGRTDRNNDNFGWKDCGEYLFWKDGKRVEEWYCRDCKFKLLCGDCRNPHELETELYSKPEYEDFYLCLSCEIQREDDKHQVEHNWEPDLDCGGCQNWAERWEAKVLENKNV